MPIMMLTVMRCMLFKSILLSYTKIRQPISPNRVHASRNLKAQRIKQVAESHPIVPEMLVNVLQAVWEAGPPRIPE